MIYRNHCQDFENAFPRLLYCLKLIWKSSMYIVGKWMKISEAALLYLNFQTPIRWMRTDGKLWSYLICNNRQDDMMIMYIVDAHNICCFSANSGRILMCKYSEHIYGSISFQRRSYELKWMNICWDIQDVTSCICFRFFFLLFCRFNQVTRITRVEEKRF
jgi:hypothetical protein